MGWVHTRCCKCYDHSVSAGPAVTCYQYLNHFHCREIPTVIQICLFEQHELCAMHVTEERAVGMVIVLEMLEQCHTLHSDTFIWMHEIDPYPSIVS